jgi:hypothetical protein
MANKSANRLLFLWLMAGLAAPGYKAQETPAPKSESTQPVAPASAATTSTTLPELAPPKLPKVTCAGDQLTISADNSTLGGILAAVHACIGVQVDIPEGAGGSRVFGELGPGPARQVMESLLNGTDFNFVIGSSEKNPQKIESVLLILRPTETASAHDATSDRTLTPARRAWLQNRQNRAASLASDEEHPAADETPSTQEAEDATAPVDNPGTNTTQVPANDAQPPASDAPSSSGDKTAAPAPTPDSPSGPSPSADPTRSTEDRITDMQQLFQQRRQMSQNQGQGTTSTSPQP